jgi:toxin ParE1/3/4
MSRAKWSVRPSHGADRDYAQILQWTARTFGARQARTYETTLLQALRALRSGPDIAGVKHRDDLGLGVRTLHVARNGRKGRHFVVFRIGGEQIIDVLRLLHDSMDLVSHLSSH